MSQSFQPRKVDFTDLKQWLKTSTQLLGRLGLGWAFLWGLGVPLMAWGVRNAVGETAGLLIAIFLTQALGVLLQPVLQHALDRAAQGHRPNMGADVSNALAEITNHARWFVARVAGQLIAFFVLMTVIAVFVVGVGNGASPDTPPPVPHPLSGTATLLLFLVVVPVFLRKFGLFDFSYWLRVRRGMSKEVNHTMQDISSYLNGLVLLLTTMTLVVVIMAIAGNVLGCVLALPALQWFLAAMTRCAYEDIFGNGSGLKEPQTAAADTHHLKPALEA